jgi:hypothetical protein
VILLLLQNERVEEFSRAVREEFSKGATPLKTIFAALAIVALVVLVYMLRRSERPITAQGETNDPQRLFGDVLPKLGLNAQQRLVLETLARDLRLPHPTAILLSEVLFDRAVTQWHARDGKRPADESRAHDALQRARTRLFPSEVGFVSSAKQQA